jgi:hypothetical protein
LSGVRRELIRVGRLPATPRRAVGAGPAAAEPLAVTDRGSTSPPPIPQVFDDDRNFLRYTQASQVQEEQS